MRQPRLPRLGGVCLDSRAFGSDLPELWRALFGEGVIDSIVSESCVCRVFLRFLSLGAGDLAPLLSSG